MTWPYHQTCPCGHSGQFHNGPGDACTFVSLQSGPCGCRELAEPLRDRVCEAFRALEREPWSEACARELREKRRIDEMGRMLWKGAIAVFLIMAVVRYREQIARFADGMPWLKRFLGLDRPTAAPSEKERPFGLDRPTAAPSEKERP